MLKQEERHLLVRQAGSPLRNTVPSGQGHDSKTLHLHPRILSEYRINS